MDGIVDDLQGDVPYHLGRPRRPGEEVGAHPPSLRVGPELVYEFEGLALEIRIAGRAPRDLDRVLNLEKG